MIDSNDALVSEFIKRSVMDKAYFFIAFLVFDAYYLMNKPEWLNQENKEYRDSTERYFGKYFNKYKNMWNRISSSDKIMISQQIRGRSVMEGMQMEAMTVDDWLKHIEKISK